MHDTAMMLGKAFFEGYFDPAAPLEVLDVGSSDVNGSLRSVAAPGWTYTGLDIAPGKGVDVILEEAYAYPFEADRFDAIVSTSCMEHDAMFWLSFCEMLRVLKPGGYLYMNVPSNGWYHTHPIDCWRFYPDAGLAFETWGRHQGIPVTLCESFVARARADVWNDFVAIFWKGEGSPPKTANLSETTGGALNIWLHGQSEAVNHSWYPHYMQREEEFKGAFDAMRKRIAELEQEIERLRSAG